MPLKSKVQTGIFCPACSSPKRKILESRKQVQKVRRRCKCLDCDERYTTSEELVDENFDIFDIRTMRTKGSCIALDLSSEKKVAKITLSFPLPESEDIPAFVDAVTRRWVIETEPSEDENCDEEE